MKPPCKSSKYKGYDVRWWPPTDDTAAMIEVDVPSKTDPNTIYAVVLSPDEINCECKGFTYRKSCVHTAMVRKMIAEARSKDD